MGWFTNILRKLQFTDPSPSLANQSDSRALHDVRGYATSGGTILKSTSDLEALMQTFGHVLQTDIDWKSSPCYPPPYIAEFKTVTVIPGCRILLNTEGSALSDEVEFGFRMFGLRPKCWEMEITDGPNLDFQSPQSESTLIPSGIHMTGEHESNYFHWIVEVLPRLFLCEKLLMDKQIPLLVTEGLHDNLYALLDIIRAPERAVLRLKRDCHYRVEQLIYPSDLTRILDTYDRPPGMDTTYLPVALLRAMGGEIKRHVKSSTSHIGKSIYISRKSSYRRLLNEREIENLLMAKGFDVVDAGNLSIEEQIGIFSHAEMIVGPSGAGMANMLWCRAGTRIVILHSDHPFKKYPYWDALARASDAKISYLAGPRAHNVTDMFEAHDDFNISSQDLLRALAQLP